MSLLPGLPSFSIDSSGVRADTASLATHAYDALHAEVLDFVIDYFGTIQTTPEFRDAVKEVSSGHWGSTGGDVLLGMFQRL